MVGEDNAVAGMSQHISGQGSSTETAIPSRPGTARRRKGLGADGRDILTRTIVQDVIPQLVAMPWLGHAAPAATVQVRPLIDDRAIQRVLSLCFEPDGQGVAAMVAGLHRQGASAEALYTRLLTPVARILGAMWEDDECSFTDVSVGLVRLQNAQRALAPSFIGKTPTAFGAPRALLFPVPGEQHTFGLSMVKDYFLRAGWDAWLGVVETEADAIDLVQRERADVIGLSFACDERIDTAGRLIAQFRSAAANPRLTVMVGGPAFVADPSLAAKVGADATAADGHQAVLVAHELLHPAAGPN